MVTDPRIRQAVPADVEHLVRLVHDLAAYERAPEECVVTAEQLHERLFGSNPAVFALVAEEDSRVVGTAIWFLNFSTWDGVHGIYLEDLYIDPAHRGSGLGFALLKQLAQICVERGYSRMQWQVLDWNTPSIDFYRSLGAVDMQDWRTYRLSGTALQTLGS
ncbi:MAG TPA: GNAT family N-acetyltransferase [Aeromicrobium sp.]|nr:GNAT family N-acetyltransferase [Aeromicrobium sp.]